MKLSSHFWLILVLANVNSCVLGNVYGLIRFRNLNLCPYFLVRTCVDPLIEDGKRTIFHLTRGRIHDCISTFVLFKCY